MTLEPRNLVMTINCCFYCGSKTEDIYWTEVEYRFGLKHCRAHSTDAKRDCNAYKHRWHIVDVTDAKAMPVMQPLFAHKSFIIPRSSGTLEEGWALNHGHHYAKSYICKIHEEWAAPMYKDELVKHVRIRNFLNTEEAAQVIAALDAGVYAMDAAAAAACKPAIPAPELSDIKLTECNGTVCRVYSADS
jgi:hypothetical protein